VRTQKKEIEELAGEMPVWVIQSIENDVAVCSARKNKLVGITVFFTIKNESKMETCSRILYNVDDHHQFDRLVIYGAMASDIDSEVLSRLGIVDLQQTKQGCELTR